jgi:hypothetical protein
LRALIAMAVLASGCDFLFRIDAIEIHDSGPADTHLGSGSDAATGSDNPTFEAGGWTAYPGDGTLYSTIPVALDGPVDRNALVVVAVCNIPSASSITVSDSVAGVYAHATIADAVIAQPPLVASIYYAIAPMPTNALEVDVAFGSPGVESPDVRVAAYTNIAEFAPFETATTSSMADVDSLAATVLVTAVPTLLVAATCVGGQTTVIDGFTIREFSTPNGDALGDSLSDSVSDEIATAHQMPADGMIVQLAAFHGI